MNRKPTNALWAPEDFWLLPQEERQRYRCGPGRGILEMLVPDVWRLGWPFVPPLEVTPACAIHDFCYANGPDTIEWKWKADRGFRNNLVRLVEHRGGPWIIVRHRLALCEKYYLAVARYGGPAFWKHRNPPEEERDLP